MTARGSGFKLYGKAESSENTAPSGNWAQLPVYSFTGSAEQGLEPDPVLALANGRFETDPYAGMLNVPLSALVPLDFGNMDFWMDLLWGDGADTGSGPTTTVWKPGGTPISASFEKNFVAANTSAYVFTGVKGNDVSFSIAPEGRAQMTVGMIGRGGTSATSSAAGTPTVATFAPVLNRRCAVTIAGSAADQLVSATINVTNGLDAYRVISDNALGAVTDIDQGEVVVTGNFTFRTAARTHHEVALAGTNQALVFTFTRATGTTFAITVPRAFIERPSIPVEGPAGVQQSFAFRGVYDASTAASVSFTRLVP